MSTTGENPEFNMSVAVNTMVDDNQKPCFRGARTIKLSSSPQNDRPSLRSRIPLLRGTSTVVRSIGRFKEHYRRSSSPDSRTSQQNTLQHGSTAKSAKISGKSRKPPRPVALAIAKPGVFHSNKGSSLPSANGDRFWITESRGSKASFRVSPNPPRKASTPTSQSDSVHEDKRHVTNLDKYTQGQIPRISIRDPNNNPIRSERRKEGSGVPSIVRDRDGGNTTDGSEELKGTWKCNRGCTCQCRVLLNTGGLASPRESFSSLQDFADRLQERLQYDSLLTLRIKDWVGSLRESDARVIQNFLNALVALRQHSLLSQQSCSWMRKISRESGQLPSSLFITPNLLKNTDAYPFAGGGASDVHISYFRGKKVCLKVLRLFTSMSEEKRDRVQKTCQAEALIWKQLVPHDNIVPFYGLSDFLGRRCLVSLYMKNGHITKYLATNKHVNPVVLMRQAAIAINYIHANRLVHGDIKSANILVDDEGNARLSDLGLTTLSASMAAASSVRQFGGGTLGWMAPELFNRSPPMVTYSSDLYSYGATLFEVLSGKHPSSRLLFGRENPAIKNDQAGYLYPISPQLQKVISACCVVDPGLRCSIKTVLEIMDSVREMPQHNVNTKSKTNFDRHF